MTAGPPSSTADDLVAWLRENAGNDTLFPEVQRGERVGSEGARSLRGIRRIVAGKPIVALLRDRLSAFVPPGQEREVEALLLARGLILPGKEAGRHVRQLRVKGLQPARRDFLLFDMTALLADVRH